jgi:hypothetical protein
MDKLNMNSLLTFPPERLPPTWMWVVTLVLVVPFLIRRTAVWSPREQWYSLEQLEEMDPTFLDLKDLSNRPHLYIYHSEWDIFLVQEAEDEDGGQWFLYTPVSRGILKKLRLWRIIMTGIAMSCFLLLFLFNVLYLFCSP